ncbi:MAG TPA: hypothetical protein VOA87_10120 [Thermoanaerobaculia bacterium]|nr:hypothetical protein [Thermoanaerobaculia bacterium]
MIRPAGTTISRISILATLAAASLLLAACSPTFTASVQTSRTQLAVAAGLGEMRAQGAAAGGSGCQTAGLIVTSGGGTAPEVLTAALPAGMPLTATALAPSTLQLAATDNFVSADNHVLRLPSGAWYLSWLFSSSATLPSQPEWWDAVAANGSGLPAGSRGSMLQLTSSDCGAHWTRLPDVDSAVIDSGRWAWPQGVNDDKTQPWVGGWDRQEVYADPFSSRLYVTVRAVSGTLQQFAAEHAADAYLLLYSDDGSHFNKSPIELPSWEPLTMTTTPSGRLFLAHCVGTAQGNRVVVYWIDPGDVAGASAPTGSTVIANGSGTFDECGTLSQSALPANVTVEYQAIVSLSRIGSGKADTVRVAYPRIENGRQVRFVIGISVGKDGTALQVPLNVVRAADPDGQVLFGSFVESDGAEASTTNAAVLYWLETTHAGELVARYSAVKDGWDWTAPADLSLAGGARAAWIPDGTWIGHYIRGGFFADASAYRYVALWPENGVPSLNVVSVPRGAAPPKAKSAAKWSQAKRAAPHGARTLRVQPAPHQDREGVLRPAAAIPPAKPAPPG